MYAFAFGERLHLPIGHGDLDQVVLIVLMVACLSGPINVASCMKEKDREEERMQD